MTEDKISQEKKEEEYRNLKKAGEIELEDYREAIEVIGPEEEIEFIAATPVKGGKGKNLILLTNTRFLWRRTAKTKLMGHREGIEDIPYERITEINTEERKQYDLIKISTKEDKVKEFMAPKEQGGKIAGIIRSLEMEKKERQSEETALRKIKELSKLKDRGDITEEEFEDKKEDLLDEV